MYNFLSANVFDLNWFKNLSLGVEIHVNPISYRMGKIETYHSKNRKSVLVG